METFFVLVLLALLAALAWGALTLARRFGDATSDEPSDARDGSDASEDE